MSDPCPAYAHRCFTAAVALLLVDLGHQVPPSMVAEALTELMVITPDAALLDAECGDGMVALHEAAATLGGLEAAAVNLLWQVVPHSAA